jgi:hypothetical protein
VFCRHGFVGSIVDNVSIGYVWLITGIITGSTAVNNERNCQCQISSQRSPWPFVAWLMLITPNQFSPSVELSLEILSSVWPSYLCLFHHHTLVILWCSLTITWLLLQSITQCFTSAQSRCYSHWTSGLARIRLDWTTENRIWTDRRIWSIKAILSARPRRVKDLQSMAVASAMTGFVTEQSGLDRALIVYQQGIWTLLSWVRSEYRDRVVQFLIQAWSKSESGSWWLVWMA